jgi:F0F1-type ATP synthase gamma subunit
MSENEHAGAGRRFIEAMTPHAGSPIVAAAVMQVMAADDPDAKAVEVTQQLSDAMKPVAAAFQRVAGALRASFGGDWIERVNEIVASASEDAQPFDDNPEDCWRCDAVASTTDVGLCDSCWDDLARRAADSTEEGQQQ